MTLEYLNAATARDRRLTGTDVYYDPTYGLSAAMIDDGIWECALDTDTGAFYPYVRRPVPNSTRLYDIVSPYGYGGVTGISGHDLTRFRRHFLDDGLRRGLVAEFLRTNPFDIGNDLDALLIDSHRLHPTFAIIVTADPDDYFAATEGRHRTAVRRATKEGIRVEQRQAATLTDPESAFRRIYADTMRRVGASSRLRLGNPYFDRLAGLGDDVAVVLEATDQDGDPVAGATFLTWGDRVHYHLSGSTTAGQRVGATNLLIDHAVRQLCSEGSHMHLGGGIQPGDGLERFKRSAATKELGVAMCRTVVNPIEYKRLCAETGSTGTDFFPAYRGSR